MSKEIKSTLEESFEYDGLWWLPSDPENEVSGRLSYTPSEGITLKLIGAFVDILELSDFQVDLLHGITTEGHVCTLYGDCSSNFTTSYPGVISQTITFSHLIVGYHYPAIDQIEFNGYQVVFWGLDEWIGGNLIKTEFNFEDNKNKISATFDQSAFEEIKVSLPDGSLRIGFGVTSSQGRKHGREFASINTEAQVYYISTEYHEYGWYEKFFFDIERFFILMTGHVVSQAKKSALLPESEGGYGAILCRSELAKSKNLPRFRMMLTYEVVENSLESALIKWCQSVEELRPIIDIFFGTLYKPDMYLEIRFLAHVQAIEGYQRLRPQGLHSGNALKYRLMDLFDALPSILQQEIHPNFDTFRDDVVNTRDYYTHYIPQRAHQRMNRLEILDACNRLRIFMTILLLREIGLDDGIVLKAIQRLKEHILPKPMKQKP